MTRLPLAEAPKRKAGAGGWNAFTDHGTAPRWVIAARVVMVLALAATIPTILNVEHGNRLVWTVCIAALPFFWMTAGYHVWRRICPLAVAGQVGRLVGRPGARKMGDWMAARYLYVQLALMMVALTLRLVATNGSAEWLAGFLAVVIAAAIVTSFVYGGKTWCNFLCPVGLVEKIHTEPSRSATGRPSELTSQCAPCVACKKHCPDIDLEQGYWKEANEQPRRVAYFAWPGIVVGFYAYYYLVAGTWSEYFSGAWTYQRDLPSHALDPGFTFAPAIPRIVAAPLTLIAFGAVSYVVFASIEKLVLGARAKRELTAESMPEQREVLATRVRHGMLAFTGLVAFNAFYCFAGQPTLQKLPHWAVTGWGLIVVFSSTAMFMRRIARREDQYVQEKFAQKILKKWEWGDAPPSEDLKDIYLLHTERTKQREARLRAYKETVREMVADGLVTRNEMVLLDSLRAQLGISDKDHQKIMGELSAEERQLFDPAYQGSVEQRLAKQQYRKDLERIVVEAARQGTQPTTLSALRAERGVSEDEERDALAALLAPGGPIAVIYEAELEQIAALADAAEHANAPVAPELGSAESASLALLEHLCVRRANEHVSHALGVLAVMTKRDDVEQVRHLAKQRGLLRPHQLDALAQHEPGLVGPLLALVTRLARAEQKPLALAPILAVIGDSSRYLRAAGAVLLTRFDDAPARDALVSLIDDPEPIVREAAVRAMGAKSRLTREVLAKVLDDPDVLVRHAAVRAVSGGTSNPMLPAVDPAIFAQTKHGVGKPGVYATLDANAAMASLTTIEKMMLIRQVPIFAKLDAEDLEELASIVEETRIEAGQLLFAEGDPGDAVYLIVKGTVRVFVGGAKIDNGGRPETTINEAGAGACIGEMAVLDSAPRSASVRGLERTRALRVPGEGFKRLLSERPEMSEAIIAELVHRMRGLMAQTAGSAPARASLTMPVAPPDSSA
ncbi:MAG TPA: cyclic nucleotide-binding domain-containing protein [Kofleriaceae bacterium]|nr:cyclic nucleotide-binding domain-containing protein [Kofleriaceae bacterium]